MLVLSRRKNESIQIGNDIEIKILAIEGDQVKIGIDAPKHIEVHRSEVYLALQKANEEAVNHNGNSGSLPEWVNQMQQPLSDNLEDE